MVRPWPMRCRKTADEQLCSTSSSPRHEGRPRARLVWAVWAGVGRTLGGWMVRGGETWSWIVAGSHCGSGRVGTMRGVGGYAISAHAMSGSYATAVGRSDHWYGAWLHYTSCICGHVGRQHRGAQTVTRNRTSGDFEAFSMIFNESISLRWIGIGMEA